MIGLRKFDDCERTLWQPFDGGCKLLPDLVVLDHELSIGVLGPDIGKLDWEVSAFPPRWFGTTDDDMVKCTSQVVYEVAEHDGNHGVRLRGDANANYDFTLSIGMSDGYRLIRLDARVAPGCVFDVYHVLLSTLDFQPPRLSHMLSLKHEGQEDAEDAKGHEIPVPTKGDVFKVLVPCVTITSPP